MKRKSYIERKHTNEEMAREWCDELGFNFIRMCLDDHFYFFNANDTLFDGFSYGYMDGNIIKVFR